MLMSRRLPESHPRPSSSIKRRLFQDDDEESDDPADDEDPRERQERHRRLQMNRQSEAENFLNRQVEELDDISRHTWNFDFRNETPINNNGGQWEWNVEVVKLSETNVPKMYLNALDPNNDEEPPDENAPANPRNCPTCSKNNRLDNNSSENLSTPTKSTDNSASQTPIKKRLVQTTSLDSQSSSSKVPKSSSTSGFSTPSSTVTPAPSISQDGADGAIVENRLDNAIRAKQDTIGENVEADSSNCSNNNDCKSD